jgi:hypothetical protein
MKQSILKKPSTFRESFENGEENGDTVNGKLEIERGKLTNINDKNLEASNSPNHAAVNSSTTPSSKNVRFFGVDSVNLILLNQSLLTFKSVSNQGVFHQKSSQNSDLLDLRVSKQFILH